MHRIALATLVLLAGLTARAEEPLTIDRLVALALAQNAELRSCEAALAAARGQRTQAAAFRNPEVSVEIGGREVRDSENVLQGNGTTLRLALMQTIEFPGKGTLRKAIADRDVEIAALALDQFRLALAGRVRLLALEYLAARSEAGAASALLDRGSALAGQLGDTADYGASLRIEAGLLRAALVGLGASLRSASLRAEEARTRLNALTGRPQSLPLRISSPLAPPPARRLDASSLVLDAQNHNPLLQIRRRELARASHELAASRLAVAPDFAIGPFFSRDSAGDVEQNLGGAVSATLPLWDWNLGAIRSARARQDAAAALRVQAERETEAAILSTLRAYEITRLALDRLPPRLADDLAEVSSLAATQYRNGSIGAQLYLDAQSASLDALRTAHETTLDAWRALLDLDLLTGGRLRSPEPLP